jgi:hypothetical protein
MKNLKNRLLLTIPIFVVAIYYGFRLITNNDISQAEWWIAIIFPPIWALIISILDSAIWKNK